MADGIVSASVGSAAASGLTAILPNRRRVSKTSALIEQVSTSGERTSIVRGILETRGTYLGERVGEAKVLIEFVPSQQPWRLSVID